MSDAQTEPTNAESIAAATSVFFILILLLRLMLDLIVGRAAPRGMPRSIKTDSILSAASKGIVLAKYFKLPQNLIRAGCTHFLARGDPVILHRALADPEFLCDLTTCHRVRYQNDLTLSFGELGIPIANVFRRFNALMFTCSE